MAKLSTAAYQAMLQATIDKGLTWVCSIAVHKDAGMTHELILSYGNSISESMEDWGRTKVDKIAKQGTFHSIHAILFCVETRERFTLSL